MRLHVQRQIVSLSLVALTTGMVSPALASAQELLYPMPISSLQPMPISALPGWQGHWAQGDLELLRANPNLQAELLVGGSVSPDDPMPIRLVAEVLLYMYGAGSEQGDSLDRAIKLGLIRPTDLGEQPINPNQTVSREHFALLMTRAIGINGAEDQPPGQANPNFSDASEIQAPYLAAVALLQGEGLLAGSGGRFTPAQPLTYAQAARTLLNVTQWSQQQASKLTTIDPAEATYLIEGEQIKLTAGMAAQPVATGSTTKAVTKLSDRLAVGDLIGDGKIDLAALLTHDGGGSGTAFYLAAIQHDGDPVAAAFLGDRITVQKIRIVAGQVAVDLLTRAPEDPMVVRPYLKQTRLFEVKDGALVPVDSSQKEHAKQIGLNPADATYLVEGEKVTLSGGVSEQPAAPGSATKVVTKLTDKVATGDLNGDGESDLVAVLTRESGGSGTFYYLAGLLHDGTPLEAAFLGDRIAVEQIRIEAGKVVVDLLTRGPQDPMVVRPYLKESRVFEVKDGALVPFGTESGI